MKALAAGLAECIRNLVPRLVLVVRFEVGQEREKPARTEEHTPAIGFGVSDNQ